MSSTGRNTASKGRRAARACTFCRLRKFRCNSQSPRCSNCSQYGKECVYDELPQRPRPSFARLAALEEENRRLHEALQEASSASQRGTPSRDTVASQNDTEERRSPEPSEPAPGRTVSVNLDSVSDDDGLIPPTVAVPGTPVRSPTAEANDTVAFSAPATPTRTAEPRPVEPPEPPETPTSAVGNGGPPLNGEKLSNTISKGQRGGGSDTRYHGPTSTLFDENAAQEAYGRRQHAPQNNRVGGPSSTYWIQKSLFAEAASQRHLETINLAAGKLDFDGVDPDLGMHLLRLHWNRQHHSFLITYRPAFMRDMACGGPYFSRLLLNAIFFGASKFSNRPEVRRDPTDVRTAGWLFRERVRQLLGGALDRSDITTIQALLVMTSSLFALGDERSAAWLYAGTAFRMIIDLGMHVDGGILGHRGSGASSLTEEDVEIRRRVFWGAFVVDKIQSLYQGRPGSLQEIETSVPLAFNDEYEELENWTPFAYAYAHTTGAGGAVAREGPGTPAYSVSCFTQLCRLSLIMNRILNAVYAERSLKKKPEELAEDLKRLHADLETWKAELPPHLNFDPTEAPTLTPTPPPHVISLLAMHNVLLILLHRPFVSDGHLHANLRALSKSSFMTCAQAATAIVALVRSYNTAFSVRRAPYLISYATYVAATIHVRIAAQPGFAREAKDALDICLMVFDENSETNWAVKRARAVIGGLMQRMGVRVEVTDATSATSRAEGVPATMTAETAVATRFSRPGSKRSRPGLEDGSPQAPRQRQRQRQRLSGTSNVAGGSATTPKSGTVSVPMESMSSGASLASADESPREIASNNGNENGIARVDATATYDIDAIISSFISNQQPPLAAAFKSLPSPENGSQQQQQYQQQVQQRPEPPPPPHGRSPYAEHFLPSQGITAYPSPAPAPMPTTHSVTSSGGHFQPHINNSLYHGSNWFSPQPPPAGLPLAYQATMLPPNRGDDQQHYGPASEVPGWQQEGGGAARPGSDRTMNVHASDLLFGFNSSVLDGVGWEFNASRNY